MTPRVAVITGVSGSGKSTVGRALADRLGWRFHDADDFHSPEHVERMRNGVPLDDAMRQPWLARLREAIVASVRARAGAVIACSALKEKYRDVLSHGIPEVRFIFLDASREILRERLATRRHHFAGASLLDSQLATLERPTDALILDASRPVDELVDAIVAHLSHS